MIKTKLHTVILTFASALVITVWGLYFLLIPGIAEQKPSTTSSRLLVIGWFPITEIVVLTLALLCVISFAVNFNKRVRVTMVILTLVAIVPGGLLFLTSNSNADSFNFYCSSVTNNPSLGQIVSWSKQLINDPQEPYVGQAIPVQELPANLVSLYPKQASEPAPEVRVAVSKQLGEDHKFVAINYDFREHRYGLFIGNTNLEIPSGKVKHLMRYKEGVYLFEDY